MAKRAGPRAKPKARGAVKRPRKTAKRRAPDALDAFIRAAAQALDLPVKPAWQPAVKANLEVTLRLGKMVADFPLGDEAEPGPVFQA